MITINNTMAFNTRNKFITLKYMRKIMTGKSRVTTEVEKKRYHVSAKVSFF